MEIHDWCVRILSADTLEEKLLSPPLLTDKTPGSAILWDTPSRPIGMEFKKHSRKEKLPVLHELNNVDKRAVCLHRFAGHELLAVEIMAYALLAFPNAPKHFRKGLANTLKEEQEHVKLYTQRLLEMGVKFGDMPLYKHFWAYTKFLHTPLEYLSVMSLTFEMANLDFAPVYEKIFTQHDDIASALLMRRIYEDEISHVSFGFNWLNKMKAPEESSWDCWRNHTPSLLPVARAKGSPFLEEPRIRAGVPEDWILELKKAKYDTKN